uniref:Fatty alcohol acetyltransferase n=1 Tax=Agrotis segetum TaxID=47767 RepID=A0A088M998_AGRSE|nr:fatty alcohol acetyltransferase [Agrotis segetum]
MWQSSIIIFAVLLVQVYSAPQFITFKEGKLGVNFGGYHAGVGLGGVAGGSNTAGGLFAEAGTPFGQGAKAGLGGAVNGNSGTAGGLYAAATAGGNVNAAAGLGGAVAGGKSVGGGFSTAQAGGKSATSVLGGESDVSGSSGFSIEAHKSIGVPTTVVKETKVSIVPVEEVKNVQGEAKFEATNEIAPSANAGAEGNINAYVNVNAKPEIVKEVSTWKGPYYHTSKIPPFDFQDFMSSLFRSPQGSYSPPMWAPPPQYNYIQQIHAEPTPVVQTIYLRKHKPHRHHVHKAVYVGGYAGVGGEVAPPVQQTVVYKTVQPIEKRVDVNVDVNAHGGAGAAVSGEHYGPSSGVTYTKQVAVNSRPSTFFQDIFNIPISTLKAVSGFLSNTAQNTGISVQKSASFNAGGYSGFSGKAGYSGHSGYYSY